MATYTVKKGDTLWSLTSRALREQTGRKPTNAEINRAMRSVATGPRENKNLIRPGEKVTIRLPRAKGSDPKPKKRPMPGAKKAQAADRYGKSTSRSKAVAGAKARKAQPGRGRRADAARLTARAKSPTRGQRADAARYSGQAKKKKATRRRNVR